MASPKVLVVEDDVLTLVTAALALRGHGVEVLEAESADEALRILTQRAEEVAVVFSDIETPGKLNGISLSETVAEQWPAITVVLTSGYVIPDFPRFIKKPYDIEAVSGLVAAMATGSPDGR